MALHHVFFLLISFLIVYENNSDICNRKKRFDTIGGTQYRIQYYCCNNAIKSNGTCKLCSEGYSTDEKTERCFQCTENQYGENCGYRCYCSENERCDNVIGCVAIPTEDKLLKEITTVNGNQNKYQNDERIVYIGCSSLLAIVVIILIAILCYKKTKQNTVSDHVETKENNNGSKEGNVVQWKNTKNYIDENEYDEIDESLLCDIKTTTHEENKMDSDEDDDDKLSIKADSNEGYLNPYQPIISTAVDVHHYSSTTNDKKSNPSTSVQNQEDSNYLHPYQSLTRDTSDTKHEYTRLENLGTDIQGIGMERKKSTVMSVQ